MKQVKMLKPSEQSHTSLLEEYVACQIIVRNMKLMLLKRKAFFVAYNKGTLKFT